MSEWDYDLLADEISQITGVDLGSFDFPEIVWDKDELESKYVQKTNALIYEPTGKDVSIADCVEGERADHLITSIENEADLSAEEKGFLKMGATRLYGFNYANVAEYYASKASPKCKEYMEMMAMVIIDYDDAIKYGFTKLDGVKDD